MTSLPTSQFSSQRIMRSTDPFAANDSRRFSEYGTWPAKWVSVPETTEQVVAAYKLAFALETARTFTIHVTADERYDLFLNGERLGFGPERGDADNWYFESYELNLPAGKHLLVARVWSLGELAHAAQITIKHGFLLCPEEEDLVPVLATGAGPWQGKVIEGFSYAHALSAEVTGHNVIIDGQKYAWGYEFGAGDGWGDVVSGNPGVRAGTFPNGINFHNLIPAILPPMLDEKRSGFKVRHVAPAQLPTSEVAVRAADSLASEVLQWQTMLNGGEAIKVAPHTSRRVIIDLEEYYCGWPEIVVSGGQGGRARVNWSEGLVQNFETFDKGSRDEIEGKYFAVFGYKDPFYGYNEDGPGDEFVPDGGAERCFSPLWWQAGRYVEIVVAAADTELEIHSFVLRETHYPLAVESEFHSDNPQMGALAPAMIRTLEMCAHETYMDCPFYEQLMYAGDTRLQVLLTYALTHDDRLPRKALRMFDASRMNCGLTLSYYPTRYRQIIAPFSLWWVGMVHDFALWRDDAEFVKSLLPGVRAVCDYYAGLQNLDGLISAPTGWNFGDWVENWVDGIPPDGDRGVSGLHNWHVAWTFKLAGELESWHGEPEMAALYNRRARSVAAAIDKHFWNEERGLYADDLSQQKWSEHTQCLALLSGLMPDDKIACVGEGLLSAPDLERTTFYFSYYLFETYRLLGRVDALFDRLGAWQTLLDDGLKTIIERPEPSRSDCHAWGSHPLFHAYATVAGIRPAAPGFAKVRIEPQLGPCTRLQAKMPHPRGEISVKVQDCEVVVVLPDGVERI